MKVRATRLGFYKKRRKAGEIFKIPGPELFSDRWMIKVGEDKDSDLVKEEVLEEVEESEAPVKKKAKKKAFKKASKVDSKSVDLSKDVL